MYALVCRQVMYVPKHKNEWNLSLLLSYCLYSRSRVFCIVFSFSQRVQVKYLKHACWWYDMHGNAVAKTLCTQFTHVTKIIISRQVWIQHNMKWYFWDDSGSGIENVKSGFHELRWWLSLKVEFSLDVLGTFSRTHTCFFKFSIQYWNNQKKPDRKIHNATMLVYLQLTKVKRDLVQVQMKLEMDGLVTFFVWWDVM